MRLALACSLFLYGPWAKDGFYTFKGLLKKKKEEQKQETEEYASRPIKYLGLPSLNYLLSGSLQKKAVDL